MVTCVWLTPLLVADAVLPAEEAVAAAEAEVVVRLLVLLIVVVGLSKEDKDAIAL